MNFSKVTFTPRKGNLKIKDINASDKKRSPISQKVFSGIPNKLQKTEPIDVTSY